MLGDKKNMRFQKLNIDFFLELIHIIIIITMINRNQLLPGSEILQVHFQRRFRDPGLLKF